MTSPRRLRQLDAACSGPEVAAPRPIVVLRPRHQPRPGQAMGHPIVRTWAAVLERVALELGSTRILVDPTDATPAELTIPAGIHDLHGSSIESASWLEIGMDPLATLTNLGPLIRCCCVARAAEPVSLRAERRATARRARRR